jgi:hypothetical protein
MGMEQRVAFGAEAAPLWPAVPELLARYGCPVQLRMIDGELAFPDETPPEGWREIRLSGAGGMVTLRRDPGGVTLVIWGNADEALRQLWHALTWACAEATGGQVAAAEGAVSAAEFRRRAELPPGCRA